MADRPAQRAGALVMALVFLLSTVALTVYVIWQVKQGNEDKKTQETAQAALEKQQADAANKSNTSNTATKEGKLEGTKLKDFTPIEKIDELSSTDTVEGTGEVLEAGATMMAHYTGALAKDGTIFQSSHDSGQPFTSPLSNLIKGWQQGLPGMKVGGTRRLFIPAALAYGEQAQQGIPANSDLVFDIELISISK